MRRTVLNKTRKRRAIRSRAKLRGTEVRPRLSVFRSNKYLYAQLIDDDKMATIVSARGVEPEAVGESIAKEAGKKGIKEAVFDRGAYKYHGRVKVLCEAIRSNGIKI